MANPSAAFWCFYSSLNYSRLSSRRAPWPVISRTVSPPSPGQPVGERRFPMVDVGDIEKLRRRLRSVMRAGRQQGAGARETGG